jgi:hypothetical protein
MVQCASAAPVPDPAQTSFARLSGSELIQRLNWGEDEWTYRLTDEDRDGISEIEAGPRGVSGLKPKAPSRRNRPAPS